MVTYRNVIVGGKEISLTKEYHSGILFKLNKKTFRDKVYHFGDWEVEIKSSDFIVARSENIYTCGDIHMLGQEACEKALDLCCITGIGEYNIKELYDKYIDLLFQNGEYLLTIHDKEEYSFNISAKLDVIDKDGNRVKNATEQQCPWEKVFRYYRFSKESNNVYDAYRWMYLVFEILMQTIAPIHPKMGTKRAEFEGTWIRRALNTAELRFQWFAKMNWSTIDNIEYFMTEQYQKIRCRLFHSKDTCIIPNEQLEQKMVQEKLLELESLCWYLLCSMYPVQKMSGGLTNQGFTNLMDNYFNNTTAFLSDKTIKRDGGKGIIEIDDSFIVLKGVSNNTDLNRRINTKVYSTELLPEKNYIINTYGINTQEQYFPGESFLPMNLSVSEVNRISYELQTQIMNQGQAKEYI